MTKLLVRPRYTHIIIPITVKCGSDRNINLLLNVQTSLRAATCADMCELRHAYRGTTRKGNHVSFQGFISIYIVCNNNQ